MIMRLIRYIVLTGLVVTLFAGLPVRGSAGPPAGPDCIFFPWLPNSVEIEDPDTQEVAGPFHSSIIIQNLEDVPISAFVMPWDHCDTASPGGYFQLVLEAHETIKVPVNGLGLIPVGTGGGLAVVGRTFDDINQPARIAGVQRQFSPTVTTGPGFTTSNHHTVSGYTALSSFGVQGEVYLPIAQTNNNWNTIIRATNYDRVDTANIHVTLREAGTGDIVGPFFELTDPGETSSFDLRSLGVPEGWIGSATVTGGLPIGAVAERVKVETDMMLMNVAQSTDQVLGDKFAALIFRDWHHWNTGIPIANRSGFDNDITITFYDVDGDVAHVENITIPGNGMDFVYLPAGDGSPFIGGATIEGTEPFVGAVDEVKYLGDDGDTGHAMSYTMDYRTARDGEALALPVVWKPNPSAPRNQETTGIQLFNPSSVQASAEIMFYDRGTGAEALVAPIAVTLEPKESYTVYVLDIAELPDNFRGSAVVLKLLTGGVPHDQGIVAVSNLVNYDVQYDGSSSFNLTKFIP